MARRTTQELAFAALTIEGGLLAPDFLNKVAHLEAAEQSEADYDIPRGLKLRDEIGRYWKIAQNLWQDFDARRGRTDVDTHTVTVSDFLEPFCRQVLGFADLRFVGQIVLDDRVFPIGFSAGEGRVPVVFAAHDQGLDRPSNLHGDGVRRRSPFLLAQEYLNASEQVVWAIVSNGVKLRILRDNPSLTRPAYIEADLEAIFSEGLYPDFTALWLLAHGTRFGKVGTDPSNCPLERWRNIAQEDGIRARDRLRVGVTEALRALGTGFISHPANTDLRARIDNGDLSTQAYFEQLLRLVYRLIFLATIEDRDLVFVPDASSEAKTRYQAGYSLQRLRQLAARRRSYDRHDDLWKALSVTFFGLGKGQLVLGLPALGGLFEAHQCPDLDGAALENQALLSALFSLCFFRDDAALSRVNYRDMDSEELGSVYESLLELVPMITPLGGARKFYFVGDEDEGSTRGNARKLTGSYYTPDALVQELIRSVLEPVIMQTLEANPQEPVKALLDLTVCDPACGSGHFLLAAARRIAEEIARLNATDGNPLPSDYRHALRDVVAHCIYGVDKNPMAVELARTALWLEAYTPDRPLTFLDHHLRCGDALLGVLDPSILEHGIPDKAFNALSGDDKDVAMAIKKANRDALKAIEKASQQSHYMLKLELETDDDTAELEALPDNTLQALETKRQAFCKAEARTAASQARLAADIFISAFVLPKTPENAATIPISQDLWLVLNDNPPRPGVSDIATNAAQSAQAFHWWQVFPHIKAKGGFDVLLGNPPWERIKLQEEEFFANRSPLVAQALHKAERGRRIALLANGMLLHSLYPEVEAAQGLVPPNRAEQQLYADFLAARRGAEAVSLFVHDSERYPLTGIGDVNTYALFAETFFQLLSPSGRAGIIVPTGIATDDSTKKFFVALIAQKRLARLVSFYEIRQWFKATDDRKPFCMMTIGQSEAAELTFNIGKLSELTNADRWFTLTPEQFAHINPNTLTCPIFRSKKDAELTKKIYANVPVLIRDARDGEPELNPWGVRFMAMFHMANDSHLFANNQALETLPLYEAKMIHQYDHRWATYQIEEGQYVAEDVILADKQSSSFSVCPRYHVDEREVYLRIADLPKGLLRALFDRDEALIILGLAHLLFGYSLLKASKSSSTKGIPELFPAWKSFVAYHSFAKGIAPTQLGLTGNNPPCLEPLGPCYLPAQPLEEIEDNERSCTAWYAVDEQAVAAYLEFASRYEWVTDSPPQLSNQAEALAYAEVCLEAASPRWLMGWRDITSAHVFRTVVASVLPRAATGDTLLLMLPDAKHGLRLACLLADQCSLVHDFAARQKVSGTHLKYHVKKQLPHLAPEHYTEVDLAFIVPRVLELTYTTYDLKPWADELGFDGEPFPWKPERRALLRAELDAYYARLYGLTRDELRYILDPTDVMGEDYPSETFRVLKNSEIREFGEYRTQRLVLDAWDKLQSGNLH